MTKLFFMLIIISLANFSYNVQATKRKIVDDFEIERSFSNIQYMSDLQLQDPPKKIIFRGFDAIPSEIVVKISDFLEVKYFESFCCTCKYIFNSAIFYPLKAYQSLNKEKIIHSLENAKISDLNFLSFNWSRIKKHSLSVKIAGIASDFSDHEQYLGMTYQDYQKKMHCFEMELKCLMLSFSLDPRIAYQKLMDLKENKIATFFYKNSELHESRETMRLMITQGIIVSNTLLENLDHYFSEEVKDLKQASLLEQKSFFKVTKFLSQFEAPVEDIIF